MFDMFDSFGSTGSVSVRNPSASKTFVVSVGGSVFFPKNRDLSAIREFSSALDELSSDGFRFVLVAGGGAAARDYCSCAKELGLSNYSTDLSAIHVTRANAQLLAGAIKNAHQTVLTRVEDAKPILDAGKIAVFGGLIPSFTTDAVGALIAEFLGATFINLTNVDGIYSKNPSRHSDAVLYEKISHAELAKILRGATSKPGQNLVLDIPSSLILRRSNIRAAVMNGSDTSNFKSFVRGEPFRGTLIEGTDTETGGDSATEGLAEDENAKESAGESARESEDDEGTGVKVRNNAGEEPFAPLPRKRGRKKKEATTKGRDRDYGFPVQEHEIDYR